MAKQGELSTSKARRAYSISEENWRNGQKEEELDTCTSHPVVNWRINGDKNLHAHDTPIHQYNSSSVSEGSSGWGGSRNLLLIS